MSKFIHRFKNEADFNEAYIKQLPSVTAIVVNGVIYAYSEPGPDNLHIWRNGEDWVNSDGIRNPCAWNTVYTDETEEVIEDVYLEQTQYSYSQPWVSYTEGKGLDYNKPDYTKIPFTVEALGSGNITWNLGSKTVQYSKNGGSWTTMDSGTTISVIEGDEVQFKGTNQSYSNTNGNISCTANFNVKGNVMSLTDGDDFETAYTVSRSAFRGLFSYCSTIVSAGNLKLPATTLGESCYVEMFAWSGLIIPPELPAMTMAVECYSNMFNGSQIEMAPELPATTLAKRCYNAMFVNCYNLIRVPKKLPATTLAEYCYSNMFGSCRLATAPELPATTLQYGCYNEMFRYCYHLRNIKAMFTTTTSNYDTKRWLQGVPLTGTFVKNAEAQWDITGIDGIPEGWTVQTASA